MTKPATFTRAEIERAIKAAFSAGGEVVVEKGVDKSCIIIRQVDTIKAGEPKLGPKQWD